MSIRRRAVSQLACEILAQTARSTNRRECAGEIPSRCDAREPCRAHAGSNGSRAVPPPAIPELSVRVRPPTPGDSVDGPHRRESLGERPIAQLAMVVVTPTPYRSTAGDGAAVRQPGDDAGETHPPSDEQRRRRSRRAAVSELSAVVVAPTEHPAINAEETAMQSAGNDAWPWRNCRWADRRGDRRGRDWRRWAGRWRRWAVR